eukprot:4161198-Amphidinium_carterae.1
MPAKVFPDLVLKAVKLRDAFVGAILWHRHAVISSLVRKLSQLPISAESLLVSGLPYLLRDPTFLALANDKGVTSCRARLILQKWRKEVPLEVLRAQGVDFVPLKGFHMRTFLEPVELFERWLTCTVDQESFPGPGYRRVAAAFVIAGFERPALCHMWKEPIWNHCYNCATVLRTKRCSRVLCLRLTLLAQRCVLRKGPGP